MEIQRVSNNRGKRGSGVTGGGLASLAFRRSKPAIVDTDADLEEMYPDTLSFYTTPPLCSISLQEFEQYAVERLKMLRFIERINLTQESRYSTAYYSAIRSTVKSNELPTYDILLGNNANRYTKDDHLLARKIDHISHYLLRLAFARTEEQRRWFIALEVDFFRIKMYLTPSSIAAGIELMVQKYHLPIEEAGEEAQTYQSEIINSTFTVAASSNMQVYKMHFTHALELVKSRNVFLCNGYAYVPYSELNTVVSLKFRSYLSESLSILKKNIHLVDDDERLRPLVSGFEKRYLGSDVNAAKSGDKVYAAQLDGFSQKSFPLCMKHLYDVVGKEHHLKHWGRLQLGLFFKGLGLPIDEATKFWRNNFTKRPEIDASRFDKQYLYNIRHMYGQEGKRADYTPYSCMKVITSSVGPGDHHGCPFRHSDATPLRVKLVEAEVPQEGIKEIMTLVEQKHFQIACQRFFEWTHDKHTVEGGVNHPNQYFLESRSVLTGKKTIKSEIKTETTRTLLYQRGENGTQSQSDSGKTEEHMDVTNVDSSAGNTTDIYDDDCDALLESMEY